MKVTLVILLLGFGAALAYGQSTNTGTALNAQPQMVQFYSHPQTAIQQSLAQEKNLLATSSFVWAQGERPLWEVAPALNAIPLGDIARMLKEEHAKAKKSEVVWEN
jgi:hypothetical protein